MSKKTSEWEMRFEEKFINVSRINVESVHDALKAFISDLLAKEKMELVERIRKKVIGEDKDCSCGQVLPNVTKCYQNKLRAEQRKKLEELRKEEEVG